MSLVLRVEVKRGPIRPRSTRRSGSSAERAENVREGVKLVEAKSTRCSTQVRRVEERDTLDLR